MVKSSNMVKHSHLEVKMIKNRTFSYESVTVI